MSADSRDETPHAVILAGGKGTRLHPFTVTLPKPLVPIGGETSVLEIILRQLAAQGFPSVTLAIGHFGGLIEAYVGDGSRWGLRADYAREESALGTIGPVVKALDRLPPAFVVLNGDTLTDLDYADLLRRHRASGAAATIAVAERAFGVDFGVLDVDDGRIVGFHEKPVTRHAVAIGAYAVSRDALSRYQPGTPLGLDGLMADLLAADAHVRAYAFDGFWLDVGRPEDYERANEEFAEIEARLFPRETATGSPE